MQESENWIFSLNIYQLSGPLESFRDSFISRQVGFLPLGIDFLINVLLPLICSSMGLLCSGKRLTIVTTTVIDSMPVLTAGKDKGTSLCGSQTARSIMMLAKENEVYSNSRTRLIHI